jgi:ATP-dependent exoDNAse (exonuclease V) beta subunit
MEYDSVQLVNDFITEDDLEKLKEDTKEIQNVGKLNEEINLLYVAVTRTKNNIYIPEPLVPAGFPPSSRILVMKDAHAEEKKDFMSFPKKAGGHKKTRQRPQNRKESAHGYIREKHRQAYQPWTEDLDYRLTVLYCKGASMKDMANQLGRTRGAIWARIVKLELQDMYG